jgi:precorrin-3B synthase
MTAAVPFARKGWCPGALRPMESGDGLIVRVRPPGGALLPATLGALARLAAAHGSGVLELTSRAALQLRGVRAGAHGTLVEALAALGLLDPAAGRDPAAAVTVSPLAGLDDEGAGARIAAALERGVAARADLAALPAKFGFVVDAGPAPRLLAVSGDVRIERGARGGLIVVADGAERGTAVAGSEAAALALDLAARFAAHPRVRGGEVRRMAALVAEGGFAPPEPTAPRATPAPALDPGACAWGVVVGWPFGRLDAAAAADLAARAGGAGARGLRLTPWRALLAVGPADALAAALDDPRFVTGAADGRRLVDCCVGRPGCPSAEIATAALAEAAARLAGPAGLRVHVSGCAKGCARPGPAALTLVGRDGRVDVVTGGGPADAPVLRGLTEAETRRRLPALAGAAR